MSSTLAALSIAEEAAQCSYDDEDWAQAAARWDAVARVAPDRHTARRALYKAGCAHARLGDCDAAFAKLDEALAAEPLPIDELETDAALEALRNDTRWAAWLARAVTVLEAWEATLGNAELRRELLRLRREDQAVRTEAATDPTAVQRFFDVDQKTAQRLREIVAAYGWPTITLVGHDGAAAAWLIVQHATHDSAFQRQCLAMLREAVGRGEAEARYVAYLEDRLAVMANQRQRYGTQFDGQLRPQPIADEELVDERRRSVGLCSMASYTRQIRKKHG
jgi:hypothetical protein